MIFLSFASVKPGDVDGIKTAVKQIISDVYSKHSSMMLLGVFKERGSV